MMGTLRPPFLLDHFGGRHHPRDMCLFKKDKATRGPHHGCAPVVFHLCVDRLLSQRWRIFGVATATAPSFDRD